MSCQAYPHTEPHPPAPHRCFLTSALKETKVLTTYSMAARSVHLPDELVDVRLPVTEITTLDVVLEFPCPPATSGVRKFEGPEEVGCLLEIGASSRNLVHQILNTKDVELAELPLDGSVVGKRDALLVDFAVATLVDQFPN